MSVRQIAKPWARALLEVAQADNSVERIRRELTGFAEMIDKAPELERVLTNPAVDESAKKNIVADLGRRRVLSKLTANFLQLLGDKGRLGALREIAEAFGEEADALSGTVRAAAVSTIPLSALHVSRLRAALEQMTGRKVVVENEVDDSLLGGLVVKLEGKVYDGSIKSQLASIRERILRV